MQLDINELSNLILRSLQQLDGGQFDGARSEEDGGAGGAGEQQTCRSAGAAEVNHRAQARRPPLCCTERPSRIKKKGLKKCTRRCVGYCNV